MFGNYRKSACSTNSIIVAPDPRKVTVLHHSKCESSSANQNSNQGTNGWLKSGGVLPLVAVDPSSKDLSPQQPVRKTTRTVVKASAVLKQRKEHHVGHAEKPSDTKPKRLSQAALKPLNCTYSVESSGKEQQAERKELHPIFNKENYMDIISHFNEQDWVHPYNPAEYCEGRESHPPPCVTRPQQATIPKEVHYSEEAKAEILLSIQQELKSWRSEYKGNVNQQL